MSREKFYITTPIYYVNASPHIGHTYTTIAADALARYHRMLGEPVFFATGTDEHGAKIEAKAREAGKEPQEFVDEVAARFQAAWDMLNISHDRFIRTTEPEHIRAVQNALQYMYDKGDIYLGKYEGLYCRGCEQYKSAKDLVDGQCPEHKAAPEKMSEECYMFKMSKYSDKLLKKIKKDEFMISPKERENEIISFYESEGIKDISFSRKNVAWGVPLPWDASHTAYVWSDAFLNYLTALNWNGLHSKAFLKEWPADVQLMSKDILRVHATIWPAMLLSLGLPLPKRLFVHGFFLVDGQKMSKSIGNVIAPDDLVKKYGVDAVRYLLMSAATFGRDGDISLDKFNEKYNADLANGLGNLIARVISLADKYLDGKAPDVDKKKCGDFVWQDERSEETDKFADSLVSCWEAYNDQFSRLSIDRALDCIMNLVGQCDRHISATKLWQLIKENPDEGAEHIYSLLEIIRQIALMLWPFMPETAERIWQRLGLDPGREIKKEHSEAVKWGGLEPGTTISKGKPLFPRV